MAAVFVALPALAASGGCASALLLHPPEPSMRPPGIEARIVERDGGDVEVLVARSPGAEGAPIEAAVLAFGGNADRAERLAAAVAHLAGARPVEVWAVHYPGFGASEGPARLSAIPGAALAAYDALREHGPDVPILCWGESIGTTAALRVASLRDVAGLVLRNPPPIRRLILVRHGWWNLWLLAIPVALQVPSSLNSLHTAPRVTAPAVFLMARADRTVPIAYQRLVLDAYAGPKREVLLAGGHNDGMDPDERQRVDAALSALFEQALRPALAAP